MHQLNEYIIEGLVKSELGENTVVVDGEILPDTQENSGPNKTVTVFIILARVVFSGVMGHESPVEITFTGDFSGSAEQLATIREVDIN